ncbi:MAG: aminotransferase class III-fold pyridoxal phosphate-dependent enzyme, partial [Dehalococcoidia bacterium]|nr:aminotransferase class III-fold pyridoxal phosphate-dependent enzyme [Dehalococcoidia bacterium]
MRSSRSRRLFAEALKYLPGGVDSPVRAFGAVGGHPLFINHGKGPRIYDEDGNSFIDYVLSWGPLILGHAHPSVIRAIKETADKGTSYGAPTESETTLAKLITKAIPSIELIRFVNSGTEATMSALRLARAFTRRDKIVKFAGCYHGHYDGLLVKAGSGLSTFGIPDSLGVPSSLARDTLVASYNNLESVKALFDDNAGKIAALIVEPV